MGRKTFKNIWGSAGGQTDQQRSDLFLIDMKFPSGLNMGRGQASSAALWEQEVQFAIKDFPFPERSREMLPVKWLNQTNHQIGADTPTAPVDIAVRYAFNRRTAELLERWSWATSNPNTGGVAQTSAIKTSGWFYWLVPNMPEMLNVEDNGASADVMLKGPAYFLEGVLVRGFKPTGATLETGLVDLTFSLSIDRYYPKPLSSIEASAVAKLAQI